MEKFVGRSSELEELRRIDKQKKAALIVILGRRRIGKSRLAEEFGQEVPKFLEFQGLPPREGW